MTTYTETIALKDEVSPNVKGARAAVADFHAGLAAANKELVKSASLGDQVGYDKALASMAKYTEGLAKMGNVKGVSTAPPVDKPPDTGPLKQQSTAWADASHAATVGKEVIGHAISGIKAAFTSLAAGDVKGAIAGITESIAGIATMLDMVVPGLGQAVSAVIKIAGGFVGITAGLIQSGMKFAIASSEAKDASLALWSALGQGEVTGEAIDEMLDKLRAKTGLTKDSLAPFATAFMRMGITGEDALEKLTIAAASAEALIKGGGESFTKFFQTVNTAAETGGKLTMPFKKLQAQLVGVGLNIKDMAKQMNMTEAELTAGLKAGTVDAKAFGDAMNDAVIKKGDGPMKRMANTMSNLGKLAEEYLGDLFEDLGKDIEPFLTEVRSLFSILDTGKPSGEALKTGIGAFFKKTFEIAAQLVPMVKHFLLDCIIFGLKAYIALKPLAKQVEEFFKSAEGGKIMSAVWEGLKLGMIAVAVGIGLLIAVVVGAIGFFVLMTTVVLTVISAIGGLFGSIIGFLAQGPSAWLAAAEGWIQGLVQGITNGAQWVIDAIKGLAGGAVNAFTNFFKIGSPSKLMFEMGGFVGEGFSGGMEDTVPDVQGAASTMASAAVTGAQEPAPTGATPMGGAAPGAAGAAPGAAPGAGTNITVTIQVDGAGKSAAEITEEMVAAVFERMALAAGV